MAKDVAIFAAHAQHQLPADIGSLDIPEAVKELLIECWKPAEQRASMAQCAIVLTAHIQSTKDDARTLLSTEVGLFSTREPGEIPSWEVKNLPGATQTLKLHRIVAFDDVEGGVS